MTEKKTKNGKQGEGGGRPTSIDMSDKDVSKQVKLFGSLCATQQEMADWFGCHITTIEKYFMDEESEVFLVYTKARATFKSSLRSVQRGKALKGNVPMMIWLGKQILGQKDRQDYTSDDKPIAPVFLPVEKDL